MTDNKTALDSISERVVPPSMEETPTRVMQTLNDSNDKCISVSSSPFTNTSTSNREEEEINRPILSSAAIRDELAFQLGSAATREITNDEHIRIDHKYYARAEYVLYRISIWKISPVFVINCSDLSQQLQEELEKLKKNDTGLFDKTVTEAIQSLMESVNQRYYHVSGVAFKVSWRFED
jgi:hypothetical protein